MFGIKGVQGSQNQVHSTTTSPNTNHRSLMKKVATFVLLLFALEIISSIPTAKGDYVRYVNCRNLCYAIHRVNVLNAPFWLVAECAAVCLPFFMVNQ